MTTNSKDLNKEWVPSYNPWLIALAVMITTFMVVLDSSIANVALPHMAGSFSATQHESTWILTSYLIASGVILPATAWFSGIFGRKNFLIICTILFTIASILCGVSNSLEMMILARILQGLGGGALMPISQSVLIESFPKEKRGVAMSIFGLGVILAPVVGPTLGGWITDNFSWNWIFYINIPFGILAVILCQTFVEDPPYLKKEHIKNIDYIGFSTLIIWLVSLQIVLDTGQQNDWFDSPKICILAIISVISMIAFFAWEIYHKDSIIDLNVFKDRNFAIGTYLNTVFAAILYSTLAILPLFLQNLLGYTAYLSGLAITPRGLACGLSIAICGAFSNKVDVRAFIILGLSLLAVSCFMFGELSLNISMINIIIPNLLCGFALGFIFIPLSIMSFGTLKNYQMTNASGIQNLLKNLGGAVGTSIVATLLTRYAQVHQSAMVGHLNPHNPVFQHKLTNSTYFLSKYMDSVIAAKKANYLIYTSLIKQATLWSFIDNFRLYGLVCLLLIPTVFLLKKVSHKTENNGEGATSLH